MSSRPRHGAGTCAPSRNAVHFLALTERAAHAEGEAASLRAWAAAEERLNAAARRLEEERSRAAAEAAELRTAGEAARLQAARAEEKAEGLRLALEEARRPFWRRWIG
jgi:flagellar biosynthesis/type III secretory pathway protein FliH